MKITDQSQVTDREKDVNVSVHYFMKINLREMEEATKNEQSRGTGSIERKTQI